MTAKVTAFLSGIGDVLAAADAGGPHGHGVRALTRLADVTAEALGTRIVAYADVVGRRARTLSASRDGRFLLGRQVDLDDAELHGLGKGSTWVTAVADPVLADRAATVAYVPVVVHDRPVGRVEVYLDRPIGAAEGPMLRLAATTAAHLVADHEAAAAPPRADRVDASDLYLAAAGHGLRTPVTVIKGYADTLRHRWDRLDDTARKEAVEVIAQRADALAALADRLLTGTLGGSAEPVSAPFDLAEAVRSAMEALPADLTGRLRTGLADVAPAYGDASSLPLVLGELVTNAARYAAGGTPIDVQVAAEAATACLRVADRGAGMTDDEARMAFERFWQAEKGDDRRYGGVGLGLYLVRQIVERQHGWVSLQPRPGGGTAIEVRLPRAAPARPR